MNLISYILNYGIIDFSYKLSYAGLYFCVVGAYMSKMDILKSGSETVQNTLEHSIAAFRELSEMLLKKNGNTANESQLVGILNAVAEVESLINGIQPEDIRVPHIELASKDEQENYSDVDLVIDIEKIEDLAGDHVDFGNEDISKALYKMRDDFDELMSNLEEDSRPR